MGAATSPSIVVATDYSADATAAIETAVAWARRISARLIAVHVISGTPGGSDASDIWRSGEDSEQRETLRLESHITQAAEASAAMIESRIVWGDPTEQILKQVASEQPLMLVIGRAGTLGGGTDGVGAVAHELLRTSPRPLLLCASAPHPRSEVRADLAQRPTVASLMRTPPVAIAQSESLERADRIMRDAGVHQLVVVDGERLIGIVTRHDLITQSGYFDRTRVDAVMTQDPISISPAATLRAAVDILLDEDINALPVLDDGKLVGVLSKSDLLRHLARQADD